MMDLNDARVAALRVATDAGLTVPDFNRIWRIIVPVALRARLGGGDHAAE